MEIETVYIGTRIEPYLKEIVEKVAKERGMNVSDFLRFLVKRELAALSFLSEDTKKAFGMLKGAQL
jgi:hypothetical protein